MISSNQTPSQLIKASAGTGKTHRLSLRILRLLALGAAPHEIVALTFTRSAAAEFVRRAIKLIKEAAEDPKKHQEICAAERGADLDPRTYTQGFFKELLVKTLLQYDQMLLGTLDSYFARLVNNFPLEVGLEPGKASTIPEHEEDEHRQQVIAQIMAEGGPELNQLLLASVQEYQDEKVASSPLVIFDKAVKSYLRFYTLCPDAKRWGEPTAIWGDAVPEWMEEAYCERHLAAAWKPVEDWANRTLGKQPAALRDLGAALTQKPKPDYEAGLRALFDFFETYLTTGETSVDFGGEDYDLADIAEHVTTLHRCLGGQHILARMRSTKGLFNLLEIYRHRYDAIAVRTGRLTFADYVNLLQSNFMPGERKEEVEAWIDQIHFRLDCQIQHWMLDEFQDTSTTQYAVLSRNILEILGQKFSGRSVFVVGDLKQSLYEWREGNRRLLTQVEDAFKTQNAAEPGTALTDELTKTWRCAPAVLAMVNAELGGLTPADVGATFPAEALSDWSQVFKTQEAMDTKKKGEALWVKITTGDRSDSTEVGIKAQAKWIAHHLRSTPGLMHEGKLNLGLSCAILVSQNDDARQFAEELRNLGVRATDETKALVSQDNPVTLALIGILQRTIHPDNQKAKALAEMCPPVRAALESFDDSRDLRAAWKKASAHVAATFAAKGARAVMDDLIHRTKLDETEPDGGNGAAFIAQRLGQLRQMASDFDKLGQRDLAGFEAFASKASLRDAPSPDSVQVITIHKSKGLEYDAVYMPLLEQSNTMGEIQHDAIVYAPLGQYAASPADRFNPAWMLKNVHKSVNALAPAINEGVENMRAEAAYGALCRLYVGMTRAKHRLVLVHERKQRLTKETKKKPAEIAPDTREEKSGNFDFLDLTARKLTGISPLGDSVDEDIGIKNEVSARCLWKASGSSAGWVEDRLKDELSKAAVQDDSHVCTRDFSEHAVRRQVRIKPSKGEHSPKKGKRSGQHAGKAFGTLVHALFEGLKWDIDGFLSRSRASLPQDDASLGKAFGRVENCLSSPDIRELLLRNKDGELWTEKHAVLQDKPSEYVSAVFDRVQVSPGRSAVIVDYKTNACSRAELVETYQEQMDLYRRSVAKMCGLPESSVETWLIHVRVDGSDAVRVEPRP